MYFDNAATTMVPQNIIDVVKLYAEQNYANAGSLHYAGIEARNVLNKARSMVANCIGANDEQIIFTSGGSESNNLAIIGVVEYLKKVGKTSIVTSSIEHPSVLATLDYVSKDEMTVWKLPVNSNGIVDIDSLKRRIEQSDVGLVSVMAVNNEIGSVQNVAEIGRLCKENNILFHTDCVQAAGTIKIDVDEMNIDFLSMSGHKFHAPKGVGYLYVRDKEILNPIIFGGGQEFSLRAGTENVPCIIGMAQALVDAYKTGVSYANLKSLFVEHIEEVCQRENIKVYFNGDSKTNLSKIVNLRFPGIDGQTLVLMCSAKDVCVSAGSACKSHGNNPSHVLRAIGLSEEDALSSIRVSFSGYNTPQEVCLGAEIIVQCVKEMLGDNNGI